jgi:hypothetical protein
MDMANTTVLAGKTLCLLHAAESSEREKEALGGRAITSLPCSRLPRLGENVVSWLL